MTNERVEAACHLRSSRFQSLLIPTGLLFCVVIYKNEQMGKVMLLQVLCGLGPK